MEADFFPRRRGRRPELADGFKDVLDLFIVIHDAWPGLRAGAQTRA
jgi:hypothetical protein